MDVEKRKAKFIFLYLLAGTVLVQIVSTACPATVHRDVKGFGPDCKYRCNCVDNEQCDEETGECPGGCLRGWMGPGCQYRNYVSHHDQAVSEVIDGDVNTCITTGSLEQIGETRQRWSVQFHTALYIVGLVIRIQDTAHLKDVTVEVGYNESISAICYKHGTDGGARLVMEINCFQPVVGNTLRISFAENVNSPLVLCEVEVYGGRLVSFNMPTQLSNLTEYPQGSFWNGSYAVDGRNMSGLGDQNNESQRTCTAIGDGKTTAAKLWWNVELGAIFSIQGFDFFGRLKNTGQSKSFIVMSGYKNSQNYETLFDNNQPPDDVNVYNPKAKTLTTPVLGDIVRVERKSSSILAICEFEVFAECPLGKCGWDCTITCMCKHQTTGLMKIEGKCPYGCSGRWTGYQGKCDTECSNTTWGPNCNRTCGHCKNDMPCSVSNGTCQDSCTPGWIFPNCVTTESHVEKEGQSISVATGVIIGLSVDILVAVVVIITVLIVRKRRNPQTTDTSVYADCNTSAPDVHNFDILGSRRDESQHTELHIYENCDDAR